MQIQLLKGDITEVNTDGIVNAANTSLLGGGGVDGAIHRKGGKAILEDCIKIRNRQGNCKVGEAVITTAGNLPSKYVIHTVGPVWNGGKNNEEITLKNCYLNSLRLADEHQLESLAFPGISTGIYRYPKSEAAKIAIEAIHEYRSVSTENSLQKVVFVCYDQESYEIYEALLNSTPKED